MLYLLYKHQFPLNSTVHFFQDKVIQALWSFLHH